MRPRESSMRRSRALIMGLLALAFCSCIALRAKGSAQAQPETKSAEDKREIQVQIEKTALLDASMDRLVFGVTLAVTAKQNVTLDEIVLANLSMNGVPLYAAPYQNKLELHADRSLTLPEPLRITVYLRDLDSVAPLRRALTDGKAIAEGEGYVAVHLGFLAKMAMLAGRAEIPVALHEEVPIDVPGGSLVHAAAIKMLDAAEAALHEVNSVVDAGEQRLSVFRKDIAENYAKFVMFAYVRYELRDAAGKKIAMEWSGVALRLSANRVL